MIISSKLMPVFFVTLILINVCELGTEKSPNDINMYTISNYFLTISQLNQSTINVLNSTQIVFFCFLFFFNIFIYIPWGGDITAPIEAASPVIVAVRVIHIMLFQ